LIEVTVAVDASSAGNDLEFKSSNATIVGEVAFANGEKHAAYVKAWSDGGGATGVISTDGDYTLNVVSGDTWHVSAMTKVSNILYQSVEKEVVAAVGANTKNLTLISQNITVPSGKTVSFSASNSKTIILENGLKMEIPAGAIQSSGTITVTISPETDAKPDSKDKPLGLSYDFLAKDSDGTTISSFISDVKIIIPYDQDLITAAGYSETDLMPKYYDETTGTWENWKSVVQDTTNNTFTITTNHFTAGGLTGGRVTVPADDGGDDDGGDGGDGGNNGSGSGPSSSSGTVLPGPNNTSVWLNWDASKTVSRKVTLVLNATNATEILISNVGDFIDAVWEPYQTSKYWTLAAGDGEKIVYVKFRDENLNETSILSDTIILEEGEVSDIVLEGDLIKIAGNSAVYLVSNGQRHIFPHLAVYQSWNYPGDFSTVKTLSSADFAKYAEGSSVPFRDGSMFRGTGKSLYGKSASAVFYVENGKLRPIASGDVYQSLFKDSKWSLVTWVPDDLLSKFSYTLGETVASANLHPDGCLVKYSDSSAVYLLKNGKKQPFASWNALVVNGYQNKKIFTISKSEIYSDAEPVVALSESLSSPVIAAMVSE